MPSHEAPSVAAVTDRRGPAGRSRADAPLGVIDLAAVAVANAAAMAVLTEPAATPTPQHLARVALVCSSAALLVIGSLGMYRLVGPRRSPGAPRVPRHRAARRQAVVMVTSVAALLGGVLSASAVSEASAWVAALAALGGVFYAGFARFVPAIGVISLGLVVGASMAMPDPRQAPVWPVLLAMSHVIGCAASRAAMQPRPRWSSAHTVATLAGWSFWSLVWLGVTPWRGEVIDTAAASAALATAVAAAFGVGVLATRGRWVQGIGPALALHGYAAAWLLGAGHPQWACLPAALAGLAWATRRVKLPPDSLTYADSVHPVRNM
ncbi:MAG: hypothetical protein AAF823_15245 [Planctomycetota bacterium]